MKHWILLASAIVTFAPAFAQKKRTNIRFSATDYQPITVILNERDYNRVGRSITFSDIPRKRHFVEIYAVSIDNKGNKKGTKLYSGRIKVEPGKTYDALLDTRSRSLKVKAVGRLQPLPQIADNPNRTAPKTIKSSSGINEVAVQSIGGDINIPVNFEENLSASVVALKKDIDAAVTDTEKIKIANNYLETNTMTAHEGRAVLSWLLFDENKLLLSKTLTTKVKDRENLPILGDAFSLEANKTQYLKSIGR